MSRRTRSRRRTALEAAKRPAARPAPPAGRSAPATAPTGPRRRPLLPALAGAAVLAAAALVYVLVLAPGARRRTAGPVPGTPTNVLLITLDTTRADHLGCYGRAAARTPALDALAAAGVRFSRAYAPAPLTLPSHASIMTGLYPLAHGARNNGHDLAAGTRSLAEIFKARGFATAAFVSAFSVDSRFGLGRGFDVYDDTFDAQAALKGLNAQRRAADTFALFSRWLDRAAAGPFFCWVHFYDPHLPYDPPSPYKEEFAGRLYDGEIAYMDHYVGAVVEALKAKGVFETTLIVAAGDHGEGLGDKIELGHGIFLYEETLRVPLIFRGPGMGPRPAVADGAVRLIDVAPTVLDLLGWSAEAAGMQGRSLVDRFGGERREDLDAVVETLFPRENFGWSELVGLVAGPWKFIQAPKPELYELGRDPAESKNLYAGEPDRAAELKARLEGELVRLAAAAPSDGTPAKPRPQDLDRLRSLGYVNFAPAKPGAAAPDPKDQVGVLDLVQRAQALEYEGNFAAAEPVHEEIVRAIPDSPESYINLALVQARLRGLDAAARTLERGLARLPDSETLLARLGFTYAAAGQAEEALKTMDRVLALNPSQLDALTVKAGVLDASGRKDEARALYERALALEPESRFLRLNYAASLGSAGRLREALDIYAKLADDFPDDPLARQMAGITSLYLGETGPAIRDLERAVALKPSPPAYLHLAWAYEKEGRAAEAVQALRRYLADPRGESPANVEKARAALERLQK